MKPLDIAVGAEVKRVNGRYEEISARKILFHREGGVEATKELGSNVIVLKAALHPGLYTIIRHLSKPKKPAKRVRGTGGDDAA